MLKLSINYLGIAKVYCMFEQFLGVFDVWNYFEQVQNHQIMLQNVNLITGWVGDDVFETFY